MKYIMIIMLLLLSCNNNTQFKENTIIEESETKDSVIILSSNYPENTDSVKLCDIADTVFYVSLDQKINSPLQVFYVDNYIFLNSMQKVYIFDIEGNIKTTIPLFSGSFDIIPGIKKVFTYAFHTKEISAYDFDGRRIWKTNVRYLTQKAADVGYYGYSFAAINDTTFVIANQNYGFNTDRLIYVNSKGKVVYSITNNERFTPHSNTYSINKIWQRILFRDVNDIYYHPAYNDTVYKIDKQNLKIYTAIVEQKIPKVVLEKRLEFTGETVEEFHKYCTNTYTCPIEYHNIWTDSNRYATRFFETSRYLIVGYTHGSLMLLMSNFLIYDKKEKTLTRTHNDINKIFSNGKRLLHFGIFNDYDGGLGFEPEHQSGEYLIMVNAGFSQGNAGEYPKRLYNKGRNVAKKQYDIRSNVYKKIEYKKAADEFFNNEVSSNNTILMIVKLKSK